MIEFVGVIKKVEASNIRTYQIEATPKNVQGNAVLIWHKDSENMQAILDIFRGLAPLADAPEQQFEATTTSSSLPHTSTTGQSPVPPAVTSVAPPTASGGETTVPAAGNEAPLSNAPRRRSSPTQPSSADQRLITRRPARRGCSCRRSCRRSRR